MMRSVRGTKFQSYRSTGYEVIELRIFEKIAQFDLDNFVICKDSKALFGSGDRDYTALYYV